MSILGLEAFGLIEEIKLGLATMLELVAAVCAGAVVCAGGVAVFVVLALSPSPPQLNKNAALIIKMKKYLILICFEILTVMDKWLLGNWLL
jgi:hypothetical protein